MAAPRIQLISKTDFADQTLVPLLTRPAPLTPAANPDTVRIRSRILGLTTNLFTYAKLGALSIPGLDWWNAWPAPDAASLPAPFRDEISKYCRISAWGWSEVVESTIASLPAGTYLYGYQPIGTAPEELRLRPAADGSWTETSERRKGLLSIYNIYYQGSPATSDKDKESKAWDALMRPLFATSWMLNRFVFDAEHKVHPIGNPNLQWTAGDADLRDATVIMLAASGKTGLAFAQQIRHARPGDQRPRRVIAVGSDATKDFVQGTGLFDEVLGYGDHAGFSERISSGDGGEKVLLMDFGSRGDAADRWAEALRPASKTLQVLLVGGDPLATKPGALHGLAVQRGSGVFQSNAGGQQEQLMATLGADTYIRELGVAWEAFKAGGPIRGLKLVWGTGIDGFKEGWDELVKGGNKCDEGRVYEL